jgi:thymidylate synthase
MVDQDPINLDKETIAALKTAENSVKNIGININASRQQFEAIEDTLGEFNSLTGELNEALKQQTKEVKDINVEYLKYYELSLKVKDALKDKNKYQKEYQKNIDKITQSEKKGVDILIKEGLAARIDLGEYLSK